MRASVAECNGPIGSLHYLPNGPIKRMETLPRASKRHKGKMTFAKQIMELNAIIVMVLDAKIFLHLPCLSLNFSSIKLQSWP